MFQIPIVLLLLFPISHALSCITENQFTATLANFDIQSFQKKLKDLKVDQNNIIKLCRIELGIDYLAQLQNAKLPDGLVRFDTTIVAMKDGTTKLNNFLEYACSNEECDKEFAIKHISWLLNAQYTSLQEKVRPLLLGNTTDEGK